MPKQFLHSDQINALHDQVRSKGMSQVMEAEIFDFGRATGLFERVVDRDLADGIAPRATGREGHRNNSLAAIPAPLLPVR